MGYRVLTSHGGRELRLPNLLYADDTSPLVESEKELKRMECYFDGVCRKEMKANGSKFKNLDLK